MPKLSSIVPKAFLPSAQAARRLVTEFCERSGMVYFGAVSQRTDDHHIVRGLTVSTRHTDDHYCIGTYDGYDVVFVERSDTLRSGKRHVWHIMEFDLKTTADLPHMFIGSATRGFGFHELLDTKYPVLRPLELGATTEYPGEFTSHYSIYAKPEHGLTVENLITPESASVAASHLKGLVMEITEQALYVYSEKPHLTADLLDAMLSGGVWLATQIDKNSRSS